MPVTSISSSILLNDAARGLTQQMVFWGQDVRHAEGNMLLEFGLKRNPSQGLKGTSCYTSSWENGLIELHGAVASWSPPTGQTGCIFNRNQAVIALWNSTRPPVPGKQMGSTGNAEARWLAFHPLMRWLVNYESWVLKTHGLEWRQSGWRNLKRLPKGKPWLPPHLALKWWELAASGNPLRPRELLKI